MKRIIFTLIIITSISLQAMSQKERTQAAYIYQFTKLIKWCEKYNTGDFVIGVLGNSSIVNELSGLKGKMVANQPIVIKTFATAEAIDRCNIIFISTAQSSSLTAVNRKIARTCTLVITEKAGLAIKGSSINFIEDAGKVVFEINKTSLSLHSLTASSKLLTLAKSVYQENE